MFGGQVNLLWWDKNISLKVKKKLGEVIRQKTEIKQNMIYRIEIRNFHWFGHLMRMPEEEWPKVMF